MKQTQKRPAGRRLILLVLFLYLLLLVQVVLFKGPVFYDLVPGNEYYRTRTASGTFVIANFQPFHTIKLFLTESTSFRAMFYNVFGNLLLFIPFGLLAPLVFTGRMGFGRLLLLAFLLSLSFELYQFFTRTGQFDVDDILLNVGGAATGYFFLHLLRKTKAARQRIEPVQSS